VARATAPHSAPDAVGPAHELSPETWTLPARGPPPAGLTDAGSCVGAGTYWPQARSVMIAR